MDPTSQNQTSFIPRKAVGRESSVKQKPISLFLALSTFVFVVAILGSGGVFLYEYTLKKNLASSEAYLTERKEALEPTTINELIRTDKRIRSANSILSSHVVYSPVASFLEDTTLKTVRFNKMEYSVSENGTPTAKLSGEAKSYGSVALQTEVFNANKQFIKSVYFSNLNLNEDGNVIFDVAITFDPDLINYKKELSRSTEPSVAPLNNQ